MATLTLREAAAAKKVSTTTLRTLIHTGRLRATRVSPGRRAALRIDSRDLDRCYEAFTVKPMVRDTPVDDDVHDDTFR